MKRLRPLLAAVLLALPGSTSARPRELEALLSATSPARMELDAGALVGPDARPARDARGGEVPAPRGSDGSIAGSTLLALWFGSSVAFVALWAAAGIVLGRRSA